MPASAEITRPAMTPLQKVAMGLVLTLVDPILGGFDAVPDVLGWVLVLLGLRGLRDRITVGTLVGLAVVSALVSLATVRPELVADLPESTGWLLSLPQIVFSLLLCLELAGADVTRARAFRRLAWAFGLAAAGPVVLYGGGVDVLLVPLALLVVVANVSLVYLLFRTSGELHGTKVPSPE